MEILVIALIALVVTIALSFLIGSLLFKRKIKKNEHGAGEKAKLIIKEAELEAENIKKDKIIEAKEKLLKMKQEFEDEANRKKNQIVSNEQKIKQREAQISKELETLKRKEGEVDEERESNRLGTLALAG